MPSATPTLPSLSVPLEIHATEPAPAAAPEPVAIVGAGCRLPGGIASPRELWTALLQSRDAVEEVPPERWDLARYYDPNPDAPGKMYTRWGGFLREIDRFDPRFFDISPREAIEMDPLHRLLLEVVWEALESAGEPPERWHKRPVGVFVGHGPSDYKQLSLFTGDTRQINSYNLLNTSSCFSAGRIAHAFGFQGPAMHIDTACSTSLLAVDLAVRSLQAGECALAVAGAANLTLTPEVTIGLSKVKALSRTGRCKAFSAEADGYVRSEGCAVVVLKRLADAIAAGDDILCVVRSTAINHDGRSNGITAPNGEAQEKLYRTALAKAGLSGADIDYVEAHGTGTLLGDFIEAESIGKVYGSQRPPGRPVVVGAIKTNLGHLEWAAGVAGLIKAGLVLRHGLIPPNLHFKQPNPEIPWARWTIRVPTEPLPWPENGTPRRAAVSSFGISGTNAHLILEAPALPASSAAAPAPTRPAEENTHPGPDAPDSGLLFCFSARDPQAMTEVLKRAHDFFDQLPAASLPAAAYTLAVGRSHFAERLALQAADAATVQSLLRDALEGRRARALRRGRATPSRPPKTAFLFSGQGAHYVGMARRLHATEPVFRAALDEFAAVLAREWDRSLHTILWDEREGAAALSQTHYAQPALFAIQCALFRLWQAWGLRPDHLIGHSLGEYAAACAAGVFTAEEGLRLLCARGRLMQALPPGGGMLAVSLSEEKVRPHIESLGLEFAAFNGPAGATVTGPLAALDALRERLSAEGVRSLPLEVSHAFHSRLMEPAAAAFAAAFAGIELKAPKIPLYSNLTGRRVGDEIARADYWVRHLREPVRFGAGVESLRKAGCTIFLEIGPDAVLLPLLGAAPEEHALVPSLRRGRDDATTLRQAVAELYVRGRSVDWVKFHQFRRGQKIPLPAYPLARERFWVPPDRLATAQGRRADAATPSASPLPLLPAADAPGIHPLLGRRLTLGRPGLRIYQQVVGAQRPALLADHRVRGQPIFPAAGYLEMALAAALDVFGPGAVAVTGFAIREPLFLPEGRTPTLEFSLDVAPAPTAGRFAIHALEGDDTAARLLCEGTLAPAPAAADTPPPFAPATQALPRDAFYAAMAGLGLEYGPAFQQLDTLATGPDGAEARLAAPPADGVWIAHPAQLDAAFQVVAAALENGLPTRPALPVGVERFLWLRRPTGRLRCQARRVATATPDGFLRADLRFFDETGAEVGRVGSLTLRETADVGAARNASAAGSLLHRIAWEKIPAAAPGATGTAPAPLIVFAADTAQADAWRQHSAAAGRPCQFVLPGTRLTGAAEDTHFARPADAAEIAAALRAALPAGDRADAKPVVVFGWTLSSAGDADAAALDAAQFAARQPLGVESALPLAQTLFAIAPAARLLLVTQGSQPVRPTDALDPTHATLWGFGRSLDVEYAAGECRRIDLDPAAPAASQIASMLLETAAADRERDVAWREGERWGARLVTAGARTAAAAPSRYRIGSQERGQLQRLAPEPLAEAPLQPDQVEIAVRATGLNFRDVLHALNLLPDTADLMPFGFEAAGVVTRIGSAVTRFALGDEAVIGCTVGALGSHAVGREAFTVRKPATLTFAQAAALPIAYLTAYYGLIELARLRAGERVLIHAAAGGVGSAAVQIALRAGAEVYCTASPAKWEHLKKLGVRHVANSRTTDFAAEIEALAGPRGIDVVLNSLSGEIIPRSLGLLREGGRFVEIGKLGIWSPEAVARERPGLGYFVFDLREVSEGSPALATRMLEEIGRQIDAGAYAPMPITEFTAERVAEAFRHLGQGRQIGKVVVTFPPPRTDAASLVRRDGTYLITGGLGGIGLKIAASLAQRGAGRLALVGRRPAGEEIQPALAALRATGAVVETFAADVADAAAVAGLVRALAVEGFPLRGIVHSAGVIDDALVPEQRLDRLQRVMAAKSAAVLHLDRATRGLPLDFFVAFSSVASLLPLPGQSTYAAANAFLDSFAHWRRSRHQPATTLGWGPWRSTGMMAGLTAAQIARMEATGMRPLRAEEAVAAFDQLLDSPHAHVGVFDLAWPRYFSTRTTEPSGFLATMQGQATAARPAVAAPAPATGGPGRAEIVALAPERRRAAWSAAVREALARILEIGDAAQIATDVEFVEMGLDSLMGTQFRMRLEKLAGRSLANTFTFDHPTIDAAVAFLETTVEAAAPPAAADPSAVAAVAAASVAAPAAPVVEVAIPPADRTSGVFPLTAAQERMWFQQRLAPDDPAYTEAVVFRVRGGLRSDLLRQSLQRLLDREEALRMSFHLEGGRVVQRLHASAVLPWEEIDFTGAPAATRAAQLDEALVRATTRIFALETAPLFHATLLRAGPDESVLALAAHHIVIDGWSFQMIFDEIFADYDRRRRGETSPSAPAAVRFADYAVWEASRRQAGAGAAQLEYWKNRLAGLGEPARLLPDRSPAPHATKTGDTVLFRLEAPEAEALRQIARQHRTTLFTVMLAAFAGLLRRYLAASDLALGVPVSNRGSPGLEAMVGMFVNTIAFRTEVDPGETFSGLLEKVKQRSREDLARQEAPFQDVVAALQLPRTGEQNPLFEIVFDLQIASGRFRDTPGLEFNYQPVVPPTAKFDLVCTLLDPGAELRGRMEYRSDLFRRETIEQLVRHYRAALRVAIEAPATPVAAWPLLDAGELDRIATVSRGATPPVDPAPLPALFERQAAARPDAVALASERSRLTYRELNARANTLARVLRRRGVQPRDIVALWLEKSLDQGALLLAIAKAGATYLPLDPATPPARVAEMLADAKPRLLIAPAASARLLDAAGANLAAVTPEVLLKAARREASDDLGLAIDPADPLYVIYTSGSTGTPKGVVVPHRGVANLVAWHRRAFAVAPGDRASLFAGAGFDAAAWEFWAGLAAGAELHLVPASAARDPGLLIEWLAHTGIAVCFLPTPIAELVLGRPWPATSLRVLLTGGDRLQRRPHPSLPFQVVNNYGPTECSVVATSGIVAPAGPDRTPPDIGRPVDHLEVHLLDAAGGIVPDGVAGEIHLAGPGLALGYLGAPGLTAERFVERAIAGAAPRRLYRTGDLARRRSDGALEFIGRADQQVKVRGCRIELAEIDRVLSAHPRVAQAAAVLGRDGGGQPAIAAAVVLRPGPRPDLLEHCRQHLPAAMVPARIEILDTLPTTANGKLDRRQLAATVGAGATTPPDLAGAAPTSAPPAAATAPDDVAATLRALFAELLGAKNFSDDASFFDLGGHSLLAVRLAARIRETCGTALNVSEIFSHPTVAGLARRLAGRPAAGAELLPEHLVRLSPATDGVPIFLACPASGSPLCYVELVNALGLSTPVYGLQAPGLLDDHAPATSVEALAACFRDLVLERQPTGPVLLAGWSYGGLVAYELGRVLAAEGRDVKVWLLDIDLLNRASAAGSVSRASLALAGLREGARNLRSLGLPTSYARVRQLARWVGISLPPTARALFRVRGAFIDSLLRTAQKSTRLFAVHYRAGREYVLPPTQAGLVLLKTHLDPAHSPLVAALRAASARPVEILPIPGDHMTLFDPPHLPALVAALHRTLPPALAPAPLSAATAAFPTASSATPVPP